jgi:site-specific DNA recombinase
MDLLGYGTNQGELIDIIEFTSRPLRQKPKIIGEMYKEQGLSYRQIAKRLRISKTAAIKRVKAAGIRGNARRSTNPKNYRAPNPPYGYQVIDGLLLPFKPEIKICRLIVSLKSSGLSAREVARDLESRGIKNKRKGEARWHHHMVIQIFNRWKDKF